MEKLEKLYEGKAKIIYATQDQDLLIQEFKDDATAFNAEKKAVISGKGYLNNIISEYIMNQLSNAGIENHLIKRIDDSNQLIKKLEIIPLEVIIRNIAAGSLSKRLGIKEGVKFEKPIFEICYKNDEFGDPVINDDHAISVLKIVTTDQLEHIKKVAHQINLVLIDIFNKINITLVDYKIEFGIDQNNKITLADEISPDSCRLWDKDSLDKLDKDRFRRDMGGLVEAYQEVASRLGIN